MKAIDLIERRNKREIVSPKFLPKMGENLKERYPGKGGRATSNYADALFSLPCLSRFARLSTTCLLKKKKRQADEIEWKTDRLPTATTQTCIPCQLMTVRRSSSLPFFLSISFPIGQKLGNRHLLRRIQSRGQGKGVVLLSTRRK